MLNYLWLVPLLPLAGFLILVGSAGKLNPRWVPWIGAGSVGLSAVLVAGIGYEFLAGQLVFYKLPLWTWASSGDFSVSFGLYLDALSLNMLGVVTGVGFLIHLYSTGFMADDPGLARFFAYMNLFVAAMLVLVLADNLVLLYLGWEGVGLCSYLLIGFWYDHPANGTAARKAFIITRVGDTALLVGLLLVFVSLGHLDIQTVNHRALAAWKPGSDMAVLAAALVLGGALGKSAQLPLQTWLPDAMAGPTPISALIHAATMVTAGVYLLARTYPLLQLAPQIAHLVAMIGATTLLVAGCSALNQRDIKRILAYSTISQIGYMFLALGLGAYDAAIFHLTTHAYFKALLFLAAGVVIHSYQHEQDIFRMGGLRERLPVAFWSFVVGSAALAALPLTAGYYSKHEILAAATSDPWLWSAGVVGAALTGLYSFRLVFVVFCGPRNLRGVEHLGTSMLVPLAVLGLLALIGGGFELPLGTVFPHAKPSGGDTWHSLVTELAPFVGVILAAQFYLLQPGSAEELTRTDWGSALQRWWFNGWGFDWLYERLLVRPFCWLAAANGDDRLDDLFRGLALLSQQANRRLSATQNGRLRWYAGGVAAGTLLAVAVGILS